MPTLRPRMPLSAKRSCHQRGRAVGLIAEPEPGQLNQRLAGELATPQLSNNCQFKVSNSGIVSCADAGLQARESHNLGLQVSICLVTMYRHAILVGEVGQRAGELLREIALSRDDDPLGRSIVTTCTSVPPHPCVSRAVQYLKRKSSHKMLSEYQALRRRYWGQHLRARGYWVALSGNVTDEVWKKYIEDQKPEEPDDHFTVVQADRPSGPINPALAVTRSHRLSGGGVFTS